MKFRFGLFGMDKYYPSGGMDDMLLSFNTLSEVDSFLKEKQDIQNYDYWELVDFNSLDRIDIKRNDVINSIRSHLEKIAKEPPQE